ncbi:hypothetical protein DIPPA_07955 [Diplonema papillatum]|nr:hypothetical protein DIPPA_07955 [Diplonema papillatum]
MSGWLKLTVVKARDLINVDSTKVGVARSDPFVRVTMDGASAPMTTPEGKKVVTSARIQTLNPVWNETFCVKTTKSKGVLRCEVWDVSRLIGVGQDTFMGMFEIEVGIGTARGSAGEAWFALRPREGNARDEALWKKSRKGAAAAHKQANPFSGTHLDATVASLGTTHESAGNGATLSATSASSSGTVATAAAAASSLGSPAHSDAFKAAVSPVVDDRWDAKHFGEVYVKWFWTFSTLGPLLSPDDAAPAENVPAAVEFDASKLTAAITRFSNWCYLVCTPWFWLNDKFMWVSVPESLLVLCVVTAACMHDMLSECFFGCLLMLHLKWGFYRMRYGPFGEPKEEAELNVKDHPDPFAWMRSFENLTVQLQYTQNTCSWISDMCDWVVEVLTWERQDTARTLANSLAVWTLLSALGLWPPFRYIVLATFWYMFAYYPMMYNYPNAYRALSIESVLGRATSLFAKPAPPLVEDHPPEPESALADAAGLPVLPPVALKLLAANKSDGWAFVREVSGPFGPIRQDKCKFPWSPVTVVRFAGTMRSTLPAFAAVIEDAETAKKYDKLLHAITIIDEPAPEPANDGSAPKIIHTAYKTPVMLVTPRDVVTQVTSGLLTPAEAARYGLRSFADAPVTTRNDYSQHAVYAVAACSVEHPKMPPKHGYVRGHVHIYGWIAEPLSPTELKVTLILGMDPRGSLPVKTVEAINGEQVSKWKKVQQLLIPPRESI